MKWRDDQASLGKYREPLDLTADIHSRWMPRRRGIHPTWFLLGQMHRL